MVCMVWGAAKDKKGKNTYLAYLDAVGIRVVVVAVVAVVAVVVSV